MMHKNFIKIAALFAMLAVMLGAFAAHGLKNMVTDATLAVFETAVKYQIYHAIGLFVVAILYKDFASKTLLWAGKLFIAGIVIFSGSLYILTLTKALDMDHTNWLGAITPVGGLCFIAGWGCVFLSLFSKKQ